MNIRLGNDGFAITGILYTLFFLFLMILFSVLAGLSTRKSMLEKSTEILEKSFLGKKIDKVEENDAYFKSDFSMVNGKYVFKSSNNLKCVVYLKKGEPVIKSEINGRFIPRDCRDYDINDLELIEIYRFE